MSPLLGALRGLPPDMTITAAEFRELARQVELLSQLLETFRQMCNDAIRIALVVKPKSRFDLIQKAYDRIAEYGVRSVTPVS